MLNIINKQSCYSSNYIYTILFLFTLFELDLHAVSVYANLLLLRVQICDATGCFVKALPMGQILHKTTTDINSRTLQAAVIVKLGFRNLKSTRNKNNKFLKYKISICLDHTYMYIVIRVPYTCNIIVIDIIM